MELKQRVILLHGLGRDKRIMADMAKALDLAGFGVHNLEYPSRVLTIPAIANYLYAEINTLMTAHPATWHFVGHSLGGIIIRQILAWHQASMRALGRVVMLGPPNHGSEVVDFFSRFRFYAKIYGPAGLQLTTYSNGYLKTLPQSLSQVSLGIIAGNHTVDRLYSWLLLPGENDGKVTVASTHLLGESDHIVLPVAHPNLPEQQAVIAQTLFFLQHGKFSPSVTL